MYRQIVSGSIIGKVMEINLVTIVKVQRSFDEEWAVDLEILDDSALSDGFLYFALVSVIDKSFEEIEPVALYVPESNQAENPESRHGSKIICLPFGTEDKEDPYQFLTNYLEVVCGIDSVDDEDEAIVDTIVSGLLELDSCPSSVGKLYVTQTDYLESEDVFSEHVRAEINYFFMRTVDYGPNAIEIGPDMEISSILTALQDANEDDTFLSKKERVAVAFKGEENDDDGE